MQNLVNSPYLVWIAVVSVILILLIILLLWRGGWRLRGIRKLRVGPVEAERFDEVDETDGPQYGRIDVTIDRSEFKGNVGDIGGIITKGNDKD